MAEPVTFHGRDIEDMSRDELLEILRWLAPQIEQVRLLSEQLVAERLATVAANEAHGLPLKAWN